MVFERAVIHLISFPLHFKTGGRALKYKSKNINNGRGGSKDTANNNVVFGYGFKNYILCH
jgi:hypothetical protein